MNPFVSLYCANFEMVNFTQKFNLGKKVRYIDHSHFRISKIKIEIKILKKTSDDSQSSNFLCKFLVFKLSSVRFGFNL